jgi:pimeloyl-ACP methyl ester carboxylesterase
MCAPNGGLERYSLNIIKFVLLPGLFSDPKLLKGLEARLLGAFPKSSATTMASTDFRTVNDGVRQLGELMSGVDTGDNNFVLVCHSAGCFIGAAFIDDPRVMKVIMLNPPSCNLLDYPLKVWMVQNLYFLQCLLNQRFCLKEKHRFKLFGGDVPSDMQATSYGWFGLQASLGSVVRNCFRKVESNNKVLTFYCTGDPTVLPKAVRRVAKRYKARVIGLRCGHHYPMQDDNSLNVVMSQTSSFIRRAARTN